MYRPELDPPPLLEPIRLEASEARLSRWAGAAGVIGLILAGVGGWSLSNDHGRRAAHFQVALADLGPGLITPLVNLTSRARRQIMDDMALPSAQVRQIEKELETGDLKLGALALVDDSTVDGDTVVISSAGVARTVVLERQPRIVVIPYRPQGTIAITAALDGGDIVTASLVTAAGLHPLRRLLVDDTTEIAAP